MIAIEANLIVRYLTGHHATQSALARALIDGERVFAAITVLLEVEWVMRSAYEYQAADVVRALRSFAGLPTVTVEDSSMVAAALDLAGKGMDFADALHLTRSALARPSPPSIASSSKRRKRLAMKGCAKHGHRGEICRRDGTETASASLPFFRRRN